jgi:hypothetical protein
MTEDQRTIIDGRNRYMIAQELGLKVKDVPVEEYKGKEEDIPSVIVSLNALRRHLTDTQRAAVIALVRLPQIEKEAAAERKSHLRKGDQVPVTVKSLGREGAKGEVADRLAKEAGITQHQARQFVKANKAGRLEDVAERKMDLREAAKQAPITREPKKREPTRSELRESKKPLEHRVSKAVDKALQNYTRTEKREVVKYLLTFLQLPNLKLAARAWQTCQRLIKKFSSPAAKEQLIGWLRTKEAGGHD